MAFRIRLTALAAVLAFAGLCVAAPVIALAAEPAAASASADEAKVRALLTTTIAALQSGKPNYDMMEPALVEAVKAQAANMAALNELGPVTKVERIGDTTEPYRYTVTFKDGTPLTWSIGLTPSGKIGGLLVQ